MLKDRFLYSEFVHMPILMKLLELRRVWFTQEILYSSENLRVLEN